MPRVGSYREKSPKFLFLIILRRALFAPLFKPNLHMYSNLAKSFRSLIFLCAFSPPRKCFYLTYLSLVVRRQCAAFFCRGIKQLCIELFSIYVYMSLCYVFIPFLHKPRNIVYEFACFCFEALSEK